MGSPFKMNPKTPLMKALVGKQKNLPQPLKQAILDSPAKSYGKSPMKKTGKPVDVELDKGKTTVKEGKGRYGKETTTTKVETVKRVVPRSGGDKTASERKQENITAARKGEGRIGTKTKTTVKPSKVAGRTQTRTRLAGTSGFRNDGTGFVKEATVGEIKERGPKTAQITTSRLEKNKGKSPAKMKGVAGLKKKSKATKTTSSKGMSKAPSAKMQAAIKRVGKKGSPVKSTGGKRKLGTEGMTTKQKLEYYKKQKAAGTKKNPKVRMGMGSSYKTVKK